MELAPRNELHDNWVGTTELERADAGIACFGLPASVELHVRVHRNTARSALLTATIEFGCTENETWWCLNRLEECLPPLRLNVESDSSDAEQSYVTDISNYSHRSMFMTATNCVHFVVYAQHGYYRFAAVTSRKEEVRVLHEFSSINGRVPATLLSSVTGIPRNGSVIHFSYGYRERRLFLVRLRLLASANRITFRRWSLLRWIASVAPAWVLVRVCDLLRDPCAEP